MLPAVSPHLLEEGLPLSESSLWRFQHEYYEQQGPAAFGEGRVPWRVSSTPLAGLLTAELLEAFARDTGRPIELLELGAGNARFAFHLLRAAQSLGLDLRYRLTDVSQSNLDAAAAHPKLRPFVADGRLTLERHDALALAPAALPGRSRVVVGNYLFDTLPHDVYEVVNGELREGRVRLEGDSLADARWSFDFVPASSVPPRLASYARSLGSGRFVWPSGALRCLERFAEGPLLFVFADKAIATRERLAAFEPVPLVRHGSVSVSVNVHALRAAWGWHPFLEPKPAAEVFGVYACARGLSKRQLPRSVAQYEATFARSPALRLLSLVDEAARTRPLDPARALELLVVSGFDPDVFLRLAAPLGETVARGMEARLLPHLVEALARVSDAHFELQDPYDVQLEVARLLHRLGQLSAAERAYRASLEGRPPSADALLGLGAALADLGRPHEAKASLQRALELDPESLPARRMLERLDGGEGGRCLGGCSQPRAPGRSQCNGAPGSGLRAPGYVFF